MKILTNLAPFYPERKYLNFKGGTVSDDVVNECTTVDLSTEPAITASQSVTTPHLLGSGSAPGQTIGNAAQLGTGPAGAIAGTDLGGYVTVTSGTTPSAFVGGTAVTLITVTFATAFAAAPKCIQLCAGNSAAAALETGATGIAFFADQASISATQFVIKAVSSGTPTLAGSTAYQLFYSVIA